MNDSQRPPSYTWGLGELVRALRLYTGLSKESMAGRLNMALRSYQRIERGHAACPPGLLDSIDAVTADFDTAVIAAIDAAAEQPSGDPVYVTVSAEDEWHRVVVSRAAVEYSGIIPILDGEQPTEEEP